MSGLEVAGVILGAVPILVSALEHYKTTMKVWNRYRKMRICIDMLRNELQDQRSLIECSLRLLLHHASKDTGIEVPRLDSFGLEVDDNLKEALRDYMGDLYDRYKTALVMCEAIIWEIACSIRGLASRSDHNSSQGLRHLIKMNLKPEGASNYTFKAAIKFTLKGDEFDQRILDLKASRTRLKEFEGYGIALNAPVPHQSRSTNKFTSFMQNVRNHANGLYFAISNAWEESCHPEHRTKLFLEDRSALLKQKFRKPPIAFKVTFESSNANEVAILEESVDIELMEEEFKINNPKLPSVKFDNVDIEPLDTRSVEIKSLCNSIQQALEAKRPLKFYLSKHSLSTPYDPNVINKGSSLSSKAQTGPRITLEEILNGYGPSWNMELRLNLAFNLASSFLQLHTTPWLPKSWDKRYVYFPYEPDKTIIFDKPFIQGMFHEESQKVHPEALPSRLDARRSLFDLGIILLEVYNRQTFESFCQSKSFELTYSSEMREKASKLWLSDAMEKVVPNYHGVVQQCFECCLSSGTGFPDWKDKMFQESVCNAIIKPLWLVANPGMVQ